MRTMRIFDRESFNKWLFQNEADICELREGCLLDNLFVSCKRGLAIIYEHATGGWSSDWIVKFAHYNTDDEKSLCVEWDRFCAEWDELPD